MQFTNPAGIEAGLRAEMRGAKVNSRAAISCWRRRSSSMRASRAFDSRYNFSCTGRRLRAWRGDVSGEKHGYPALPACCRKRGHLPVGVRSCECPSPHGSSLDALPLPTCRADVGACLPLSFDSCAAGFLRMRRGVSLGEKLHSAISLASRSCSRSLQMRIAHMRNINSTP